MKERGSRDITSHLRAICNAFSKDVEKMQTSGGLKNIIEYVNEDGSGYMGE